MESEKLVELIRFMYVEKGKNMNMMEIATELNIPLDTVRRVIIKNRIYKNRKARRALDESCVGYYSKGTPIQGE